MLRKYAIALIPSAPMIIMAVLSQVGLVNLWTIFLFLLSYVGILIWSIYRAEKHGVIRGWGNRGRYEIDRDRNPIQFRLSIGTMIFFIGVLLYVMVKIALPQI